MTSKRKQNAVWKKASRIPGKNPKTHRKDRYGNPIFRNSYGKDSPMGWQMDHIIPKSKGGGDTISNLQALQTAANRKKGNKHPYRPKRKR